jgi:GDPmannose 4,6-dehydratase
MGDSNYAIVVGASGQDGKILTASLESQNITVIGISRSSIIYKENTFISKRFSIIDENDVSTLIQRVKPREVYYLAAHHVSSQQEEGQSNSADYDRYHETHVIGLLNFLCAIRDYSSHTRLFYASSSLIFDGSEGPIQNESTPFTPVGFYGLTKAQGIYICRDFKRRYNIFCSSGILYNHESIHRPGTFLSKKVIVAAHKISVGQLEEIYLGNLSSETDWGYAPDYVDAFQKILRIDHSDDFIIATGETHSVREFVQIVCESFGLNFSDHIRESPSVLKRKLQEKCGDSSKLRRATGWSPSLSFRSMVEKLVESYIQSLNSA